MISLVSRRFVALALAPLCFAVASPASAQDAPKKQSVDAGMNAGVNSTPLPLKLAPRPTTGAITSQDLMTRLYIFADDSLAGRDVGTEGHYKATTYIAGELKRLGLKPMGDSGTFFQTLPLKSRQVDRLSSFVAGGTNLALGQAWGFSGPSLTVDDAEVFFAGPLTEEGMPPVTPEQAKGRVVAYSITNNPALQRAVVGRIDAPAGSLGVLFLLPAQARGVLNYVLQGGLAPVDPNAPADSRLFVTDSATMRIFGNGMNLLVPGALGAKVNIKAVVDMQTPAFPARNVVAMIPGSDPKLATQYVAIGAHSDHVGTARRAIDHDSVLVFNRIVRPAGAENSDKFGSAEQFATINAELAELRKTKPSRSDSIFNGADDDGSGSMAVLEIAEYLATQKTKPKRSTLFVWHAGEEKGLWGSAHFTEYPTVPRESIVAQLNMDMVGRGSATDQTGMSAEGKELRGGPDYLQLVGSRRLSTELGDLVEQVNRTKQHNFTFDYAMDANGHPMNIYCRSDHYEYAKWNIPVTFFTTGGHSAYHQLTDEPQYIDYPHMQRVSRLVADIAMAVGNAAGRPKVDGAKMDPRGSCKQ
ncbi:M28 family metallopeptidase [Gemmatimonas sp.]|uniref:M28 family metallopeptidase n=1 Tax=Gemmatimonas sp. TaxID=1962908 RepID=UPI0027BAE05A|nr:M28 family peptidase [Gemmatimonas sp.]